MPPTLRRIYAFAKQTGRRNNRTRHSRYQQRCAVRVTYVGNKTTGQWKAHGRYLARESATYRAAQRQAGFDQSQDKLDVADRLNDWQDAGDPRLWKIILSPEFADKLEMQRFARSVMERVEEEIGDRVEWVAVVHYNTAHPHVHVAMRGVDRHGREVRLATDFVKHGIRRIGQEWCTQELGYRTRAQAMEAQRREVNERRLTGLDRMIARANSASAEGTHFPIACQGGNGRRQYVVARLVTLEGMGLSHRLSADTWEVRRDFDSILRGMGKMADRQKTLAAGGILRSDERLPIQPLDHRAVDWVEGRILVHGEEENGPSYMILESTDAKVYTISHTRRMQQMRNAGRLQVGTFVRLQTVVAAGRSRVEIEELGDADSILENRGYLRETVQRLLRKGIAPREEGWSGWLGRYQRAITQATKDLRAGERNVGIHREVNR
jgi:type IV secretory pathway VirD2 relaxase